ncbi:hypothetical protein GCM10027055_07030 [Janibacter alkaliphilus]
MCVCSPASGTTRTLLGSTAAKAVSMVRLTPTPAATSAMIVQLSGACCAIRGTKPASCAISSSASRTSDPLLALRVTQPSSARSARCTSGSSASGWLSGMATT